MGRWNPHVRTKYTTKDCLFCKSPFDSWDASNRKCCSVSCAQKLRFSTSKPWNKGLTSEGTKLVAGSRHWNWKGGIYREVLKQRDKFNKYYKNDVLKRDNYTCQLCNKHGGRLHVDHIKRWSEYPELRFDLLNCRTLCEGCHYRITFNREMPKGHKWGKYTKRSKKT